MKVKAGFLQFQPVFGNIGQNVRTITAMLRDRDFDLMVLPELCTTGYQFISRDEVLSLSEPADGELGQALLELAKEKSSVIVAGFA
ncbi:MAG: acyltransferase, partial [Holophagae bacterium]|nr:acyltransferase [Holophagae bacterium]